MRAGPLERIEDWADGKGVGLMNYSGPFKGILVLGLWLFGLTGSAMAEALEGQCVAVYDGDTITLMVGEKKEKIRLLGIDAPEMKQAPWGIRSRDFARGLVLNKSVRVETDVQPRDRYGRLLGYVYVGDTFINRELVRQGHAVLLTYPPNVRHVEVFTAAQKEARENGRGIWDAKQPLDVSPRDFRRGNKSANFTRGAGLKLSSSASPLPAASQPVRFNKRSKRYHSETCGHPCATCETIPLKEAEERGGRPCKTRR